MTIKKYLHSCVLIENQGKKLLFDPGAFVFIENKLQPLDIEPVDIVIITHSHPDHYFPEALKQIFSQKPFKLIANEEIIKVIQQDGLNLPTETITEGESKILGGFTIQAFNVPHEKIPNPCPQNTGYKINDLVYHPGDSYFIPNDLGKINTLLLPNGGPWATTQKSVEFAKKVQPKTVIPIHDAMHKDFWIERLNTTMNNWMNDLGIEYKTLSLGEDYQIF